MSYIKVNAQSNVRGGIDMGKIVGAWMFKDGYTLFVYGKHPCWLRRKILKWLLDWDYVKVEE